ncbi:MAG TPA: DUF2291 domain-containing protein [Sphaerochaeta sp.]|nr:DUF2291 domain-containing protein [Sphaerochaeta sp.]
MRSKRTILCVLLLLALLSISCTIEKHDKEAKAKAGSELEIYFGNTGFDAKQYVSDIWEEQVIPCILSRAVPFEVLIPLIKYDLSVANAEYGYRIGEEGTLFNFAVQGIIKVIAIDQTSRNGLLYFQPGDCSEEYDYVLQIGPVYKGTSIRDTLDFISLNDFENQVEFARFANELNFRVRDEVLAGMQFEELIGREVEIVAVFSHDPKNQVNIMTPVAFEPVATLEN